ncbi:MAG: MFS transporter [Pirellulales bacterium]
MWSPCSSAARGCRAIAADDFGFSSFDELWMSDEPASEPTHGPTFEPFRWPDFRRLFVTTACATLASRALAVVLGYQVYEITGEPLALGFLGLIEAIPALSLALYGGHVADRHDRRLVLHVTLLALAVCGAVLCGVSLYESGKAQLIVLYAVVLVVGVARGFAEPAAAALEAQVVPWELLVRSSTLMASCWLTGAVIGPLWGGVSFKFLGPAWTYLIIGLLYFCGWLAVRWIEPRPNPNPKAEESIWESISVGVRYVWNDQVLLASMALDLFAVLFGGAIALLPVFAKDILHVGPIGLGVLNAAPTTGALLTMLWATHSPPVRHAGRNLFLAVGGFGIAMIVFALSETMWISVVALFFSGVFDGVSVVIRRAILRLLSPITYGGGSPRWACSSSDRRTSWGPSRAGSRPGCWAPPRRFGPGDRHDVIVAGALALPSCGG